MTAYIPLHFEVHVDFAKAGISVNKQVKYEGKTEPLILTIDPMGKKITYHTREKRELVWGNDIGGAYHCDALSNANNGFVVKYRGNDLKTTTQLCSVEHVLAGCNIDNRLDRDLILALLRTTQSKDGVMEYLLEKYYKFPRDFVKATTNLMDRKKRPIRVVTTVVNTLVFFPTDNPIPMRSFLYTGYEVLRDSKKNTASFFFEPNETPEYKRQCKEWENKKDLFTVFAESDKDTVTIAQHAVLGRRYLTSPACAISPNIDILRDEMYEKQKSLVVRPAADAQPTRRETISLEQQALQVQQARQRASALPIDQLAPSTPQQTSHLPHTTKRGTLLSRAKGNAATPISPTHPSMSSIREDEPPPPPMMEDDAPPPPPPVEYTLQTARVPIQVRHPQQISSAAAPPPPPPDDDDDLPPPPPGFMTDDMMPPPPDDDDDLPPPPSSPTLQKQMKPASQYNITNNDIPLVSTPKSAQIINTENITLPPPPTTYDDDQYDDMPPPSLSKQYTPNRRESQYSLEQRRIAEDHQRQMQQAYLSGQLAPSPRSHQQQQQQFQPSPTLVPPPPAANDVQIETVEEGDVIKQIRTETNVDLHTGELTTKITETIRHRSTVSFLPEDAPLPPTPCPAGCHYKYTTNNPLTRKCQLLMEDAVLGILDSNFKLPFTSANGEPVYGIIPDQSCDLDSNFIMTTNGLIIEYCVGAVPSLEDTVIAQVKADTAIHLLGRCIARPGQTLTFFAQGCIPGSEIEMEQFMPTQDEEIVPPSLPDSLPPPPTASLPSIPPQSTPTTKPAPLSIDITSEPTITTPHSNITTPLTPLRDLSTPNAVTHTTFTFGSLASGLEVTIKLEGEEEPIGVVEIPSDVSPLEYYFSTLRDQLVDELDDLPEEFVFLFKGAKLTAKQEAKKQVAGLTEPIVTIRDVKKYEQQKAAEEEARRLEEIKKKEEAERIARLEAQKVAPGRAAPAAPPRAAPRPGGGPSGQAPNPPPGAPRGIPPGARPPGTSPTSPTVQSLPPTDRPMISAAALMGGFDGLKKTDTSSSHPAQREVKSKPNNLLADIKNFQNQKGLKKVDHEQLKNDQEKRKQRQSLAGGMFVSLKAAMASRRAATIDDVPEDESDQEWD